MTRTSILILLALISTVTACKNDGKTGGDQSAPQSAPPPVEEKVVVFECYNNAVAEIVKADGIVKVSVSIGGNMVSQFKAKQVEGEKYEAPEGTIIFDANGEITIASGDNVFKGCKPKTK